ncbi:MAG: neutral zinc metallopeptidase [Rubrivivax sp.]|nr:neutral zinc metallopeptidase [Rubrivivax sp.]MBK7261888.1 neutral zinc metallopeptidase [Rubrivivax sp.]MBK8528058.1 neutral zinc metallopeptidase [Rubrivivax sp.]
MKWEGKRQSDNVEDRRDEGGRSGGGLGGLVGGRGIGLGTIVVAVLAGWIFGINPLTVLGLLGGTGDPVAVQAPAGPAQRPPPQDREAAFVSTVLADTEDVWSAVFKAGGGSYDAPRLVLFHQALRTACGEGEAAMGPFYCPGDRKVYIDLDFFRTLRDRLGAPGDFAQAYVIAHEVGHHVQNLLGLTARVEAERRRSSPVAANETSVRVELQADCLAGVWAHHSQRGKGWLEQGDLQEAMNAAAQIGDDTLQRGRGSGRVVSESFTHGSSAQRMRWFQRGYQAGEFGQCNTLSVDRRQL